MKSNYKQKHSDLKKTEAENSLLGLLAIAIFLIAVIAVCSSCNAEKKLKRKEAKALKPYNQVITDRDTSFSGLKKQAAGDICLKFFPIESKTIYKDTIIYKERPVINNTEIDKLRRHINTLTQLLIKKGISFDKDSFYQTIYDSVLRNLPNCIDTITKRAKEVTKKDTVENYRLKQVIDQLNNKLFDCDTAYKISKANESKALKELEQLKTKKASDEKNIIYILGCLWNLIKWWFWILLSLFVAFKIITKSNFFSIIKSFVLGKIKS